MICRRCYAGTRPAQVKKLCADGVPEGSADAKIVRDRSVATADQALLRQATVIRPEDTRGAVHTGRSCGQDEFLYAKDGMFCGQDKSLYAGDGIYSAQDWQLYSEDGMEWAQDKPLYAGDGMDFAQDGSSGAAAKALCPL